jgi:hypothetical protein
MSKRRSASVVTKAVDAFKQRWMIQANNPPFYNRPRDYAAIGTEEGTPSFKPVGAVENTMRSYPELEFNTSFYKRHTMVRAVDNPTGQEGEIEPLGVDRDNMWDQPYHLPVPEWTNDPKALAKMVHQAMYHGYINSGSQWRPTAEDIVIFGMDNDWEYFHD